ncbi:MAG: hypothetical protein AAF799_01590 [Myxococcota bacterium]
MRRQIREHRRGRGVVAPASSSKDEAEREPVEPEEPEEPTETEPKADEEPREPPFAADRANDEATTPRVSSRPRNDRAPPPEVRLLVVEVPRRGSDRRGRSVDRCSDRTPDRRARPPRLRPELEYVRPQVVLVVAPSPPRCEEAGAEQGSNVDEVPTDSPIETVVAISPHAILEIEEEEPVVTPPRMPIDGWVEADLDLDPLGVEPTTSPDVVLIVVPAMVEAEPVFAHEQPSRHAVTVEGCDGPPSPRWGLSSRGEVHRLRPAVLQEPVPGWSVEVPSTTHSPTPESWGERFAREFAAIAVLEGKPAPRVLESHQVPNVGVGDVEGEGSVVLVNPAWMQRASDAICGGDEDCQRDLIRGIAGHEWGHIRDEPESGAGTQTSHERELRADRSAGRIVAALGASLDPLLDLLAQGSDEAGPTHPGAEQRREAVLAGSEQGRCRGIGDCGCDDCPSSSRSTAPDP